MHRSVLPSLWDEIMIKKLPQKFCVYSVKIKLI